MKQTLKQLAVLEGCGHSPMIDQPEPFADIVRKQLLKTEKEVKPT